MAEGRTVGLTHRPRRSRLARVHRAWWVAVVAFVALLGAAGFRATPSVLMVPLQEEFGWSRATVSLAVSVNLMLFGLTAPFAAALMKRFGMRLVTTAALVLVAIGSGLTVFIRSSWQLVCSGACSSASAPGRWPSSSLRRSRSGGSSPSAAWSPAC